MFFVTGASSIVGRQVVAKLLQESAPVRVLVRQDSHAEHFSKRGAEVVQADIGDIEALRRACRGTQTVISLAGRHFSATEASFWQVDVQGNENLCRAAQENRVQHFILISALWADRNLPPVIFRAKRRAEEILMQSGLPSTIIRPCTFVEGPSSLIGILGPTIERYGIAFIPFPDSKPISFITTRDLVDAIIRVALGPPRSQSQILELGGAESPTLAEAATCIANVLQKDLRVIRLPRFVLKALRFFARLLGFGPYEAILFLEMLRDHGFFCDPAPLRELLGREPQRVMDVLAAYYSQHGRTAWRDSIYGTLFLRSH